MMRTCREDKPRCVGFIQLVFFDDASGDVVVMAGAGFVTREEDEQAWANVPAFDGFSSFQADRLDANGDIVDERTVSARTCEQLTRKPIEELMAEGRRQLAQEKALWEATLGASRQG